MKFGRSLSLAISRKEIERPINSEGVVRSHGEEQRGAGLGISLISRRR
jgi:hypothetical protein